MERTVQRQGAVGVSCRFSLQNDKSVNHNTRVCYCFVQRFANWYARCFEDALSSSIVLFPDTREVAMLFVRFPKAFVSLSTAILALAIAPLTTAAPFFFSTGDPDGLMASATRPDTAAFEIESADDFILANSTAIGSATFTGLLTGGATIGDVERVVVEIYRVFPLDSDVGRTSGPPTFSTPNVPTRVNSPSDVALDDRDSTAGTLAVTGNVISPTFTANNSVQPGGIHPKPLQTTGGDGSVTGAEVEFDVTFATPFALPAGHYFFVPQVQTSTGDFLWLSAPKPIAAPGTPFTPDLQSWTRDAGLDPDWLRVGTDIVGAGTFNATFSLTGVAPEPGSLALLGLALAALGGVRRRSRK
jgi:hypothetical protein